TLRKLLIPILQQEEAKFYKRRPWLARNRADCYGLLRSRRSSGECRLNSDGFMTAQEISIEFEFPVDIYPSTDTITRSFEATKVIVGRLPEFMRALFPDEPDLHPVSMQFVSIEHRAGSFIKDLKILVEFPKKFAESVDRLSNTIGRMGEEWKSAQIKKYKVTISMCICVMVIVGGCSLTTRALDVVDKAVTPPRIETQKPIQKKNVIENDGIQYQYITDPESQEGWDRAGKVGIAKGKFNFKTSLSLNSSHESAQSVLHWIIQSETLVDQKLYLAFEWFGSDADRVNMINTCVDFLTPSLSVESGPALRVDGREVVSATSVRHLVGREVRPAGTPPRP
ncbi:MAG: hypothetical protein ACKO1J_13480, partial [Tagaea sp.]